MTTNREPLIWRYAETNALYEAWCIHNAPQSFDVAYEVICLCENRNRHARVYRVFSKLLGHDLPWTDLPGLIAAHKEACLTIPHLDAKEGSLIITDKSVQ